jgi:hypothetical protein
MAVPSFSGELEQIVMNGLEHLLSHGFLWLHDVLRETFHPGFWVSLMPNFQLGPKPTSTRPHIRDIGRDGS